MVYTILRWSWKVSWKEGDTKWRIHVDKPTLYLIWLVLLVLAWINLIFCWFYRYTVANQLLTESLLNGVGRINQIDACYTQIEQGVADK